MTVAELIEHLEQCDPAATVRIAYQPNYPLWTSLGGATETEDGEVYVVEGGGGGYASSDLWELAWR